MTAAYTGPMAEDLDCIPADLKARPQWVLWRGADRIDTETGEITGLNKIPMDPQTLRKASSTDPLTWGTFVQCVAALPVALEEWEHEDAGAYRGGSVGFVFDSDDPYCGVDLDHCRDPDTGMIELWAQAHVDALASYTEVTPSGTGVHVLVQGALPPRGRKKGQVEMYSYARFFTMTGWHLHGTPPTIEARHEALVEVHGRVFGPQALTLPDGTITCYCPACNYLATLMPSGVCPSCSTAPIPPPVVTTGAPPAPAPLLEDAVLLDKARAARNGTKVTAVWAGDTSAYGHDDSVADIALCSLLAFWTQDPAQLDRLFRQSGLMRDKWDEQRGAQTYGERTIMEAIARQTKHYTPRRPRARDAQQRQNGQKQEPAGTFDSKQEHPQLDETIYGPAKPKARPADALPWSDYVNALHLVREHRVMLRYCWPWRMWLVWTGTHWQQDSSGEVMRTAKQTIKRLAQQVQTLADEEAKALLRHVKTSLATLKLKAMVESAQSEPGIPVQPEDLDAHGWFLNCVNGTLNLQTGQLQPHLQADLLTKCLSIPYEPAALCPTWERFLWRIMGGTVTPDEPDMTTGALAARQAADDRATRLMTFLQRAIGYSLTGSTSEQCLLVFHGSGANGKSTLLELLQALLGDYAQSTPSASLLAKERYDGIPNDIARLRGARLVTAVEIGEGKRLNEELVKRLTGQDTLTARFLHAEFFDFTAEFKLYLACNNLPQIRGTDHGIWRRVKLIPFDVTIPDDQQDKTLPAQLLAELPGILAWAVQGCLAWQQDGLKTPEEVTAATSGYRASMDVIGRFIEECCLVSQQVRVKANDLYGTFKKWCDASGEYAVTLTAFGNSLEERGFAKHKVGVIWRLGIGLIETTGGES